MKEFIKQLWITLVKKDLYIKNYLKKFAKNIIIPTMLTAGFVTLGVQALIKANIFQIY